MFERFRNFLHLSLVLSILIGLIFLTSRFSSSEPATELAKTGETPGLDADATRPFGSEAPHLSATQIPALSVSIVPSARFNFAEHAKEQGVLDQFVTDKFNTQLGWQGVLVFAEDNAVRGPNSFIGGWKTYLVLQRYGTSKITAELEAFRVSGPKDQWVYKPYFSPDGRQVAFTIGNPYSRSGTGTPYIWRTGTTELQEIVIPAQRRYGNTPLHWSNSGRFLAFFLGGMPVPLRGGMVPSSLYLFDVQSEKGREVAGNEALLESAAWSASESLLFSALPEEGTKPADNKSGASGQIENPQLSRPDIYEVSMADEQAKMIIRDGYKPAPSPNGRWIAYFGSKNHQKPQKPWTGRAAGEYLLLDDLSSKKSDNRVVIRKETGLDFPILRWTPDSRTLLIIKPSITDNAAIEAQISGYDTEKSRLEHLAGDKITKADSMNWNDFRNPFFRVVEVAQNGTNVFYELMLFGDSPSTNGTFLKATNLHTGSVTTLARTGSVHRLDWHDTSAQLGQASQ